MEVGDAYVFPGFLTLAMTSWLSHTSTDTTFLSKATNYFSHMLLQRWDTKYAGKKSRLNWASNSQPPGHESDMLNTKPPGRGPLQGKAFICEALSPSVTRHSIIEIKQAVLVKH